MLVGEQVKSLLVYSLQSQYSSSCRCEEYTFEKVQKGWIVIQYLKQWSLACNGHEKQTENICSAAINLFCVSRDL